MLSLDREQRESLEHQFFDTSPDGVVVIGVSGHILAANAAQARMYRYASPEGLVGVPAPLLVAPDCREFAARIMHRRLGGEEIPPVEYELIRKDGTTFYGETSAASLRTADGAIWGYICTTRDTTERRRADELLRRSEKRYEVMFDSAPLAINVTKGTAITYANPAYLEMFGVSSLDELRALPPLELISPGWRAQVAGNIQRRAQGLPVPSAYEAEGLRRDGTRFPILMQLARPAFADGPATVGFISDITERKQAEQDLAGSEARFRSLIQHSTDLIFVVDRDGRLIYGSPSGRVVLGYDAADLVGGSLMDLVHPDDVANVADQLGTAFAVAGISPPVTFRVRHATGGWRWLEAVGNNLLDNPEVAGLVINARDITQQREGAVALDNVNRVLRTLLAADSAVVHAHDEGALLDQVCRVIVDTGGYALAGIVAPNPADAGLVVLASHGGDPRFIAAAVRITRDQSDGPFMRAVHTGRPILVQDYESLPPGPNTASLALEYGYRSALALPLDDEGVIVGALVTFSTVPNAFTSGEVALFEQLAADVAFGLGALRTRVERQRYLDRVERTLQAVVDMVAATVELRDPSSGGHQRRVAQLATAIARDMGLDEDTVASIEMAAAIHDIGKIAVPADILSKPARLSAAEYELIKQHAEAGYDLVKGLEFPWPVAQMILQHHERMDGSGYPSGLIGAEILMPSRIIAVADTVEAMASHRPYRPSLGLPAALAEIERGAGTTYDEAVATTCLRLLREGRFVLRT